MEVWNLSKGVRIAWQVEVAASFWKRFKGWMGRAALADGAALWIKPCNGIHTWFMKQPIDVVFLDRQHQIVAILHSVLPYRVSKPVKGAQSVIELPAGTMAGSGTELSDRLAFERPGWFESA